MFSNIHFLADFGEYMSLQGKAVLLIANGLLPRKSLVDELAYSCEVLVACDGGANHCLNLQITPDYITGDFDSIQSAALDLFRKKGAEIIEMENQDSSDLAKALTWLEASGAESIDVVGIEGGRIDHQFGAWTSLIESNSFATLHYDDFFLKRVPNFEITVKTKLGKIVSLHPISKCDNVIISGCRYELQQETMNIGTKGIHNIATEKKISVSKSSGELFLMVER